jgi:hypothetical protein
MSEENVGGRSTPSRCSSELLNQLKNVQPANEEQGQHERDPELYGIDMDLDGLAEHTRSNRHRRALTEASWHTTFV